MARTGKKLTATAVRGRYEGYRGPGTGLPPPCVPLSGRPPKPATTGRESPRSRSRSRRRHTGSSQGDHLPGVVDLVVDVLEGDRFCPFSPPDRLDGPSRTPFTVTDFRSGASSIRIGAIRVGFASPTNLARISQGPPRIPSGSPPRPGAAPPSRGPDTMITCFHPPSTITCGVSYTTTTSTPARSTSPRGPFSGAPRLEPDRPEAVTDLVRALLAEVDMARADRGAVAVLEEETLGPPLAGLGAHQGSSCT